MKKCKPPALPPHKRPWTPFVRATIPRAPEIVAYVNSRYEVWVRRMETEFGPCVWLSIKERLVKGAVHDWRDMQRIKNELVEAVELYPAESRMVDTSNQYHLWCFPGRTLPFGYVAREVADQVFQAPGGTKTVQRPFDERPADCNQLPDEQRVICTEDPERINSRMS